MKTFELLKNGNVATTVWANVETKEIYQANKNSFGYNAEYRFCDWFYEKYGKNLKRTQGKSDYTRFYYSAKSMESVGFKLVLRGTKPLF